MKKNFMKNSRTIYKKVSISKCTALNVQSKSKADKKSKDKDEKDKKKPRPGEPYYHDPEIGLDDEVIEGKVKVTSRGALLS